MTDLSSITSQIQTQDILGIQGTEKGPKGPTGASTTSTVSTSTTPPTIPAHSNTPTLPPTTTSTPPPPKPPTAQDIEQELDLHPETDELLSEMVAELMGEDESLSLDDAKKLAKKNLAKELAKNSNGEGNVKTLVGKALMQKAQNQGKPALSQSIKMRTMTSNNPFTQSLVDSLTDDFIKEGKTPEEAKTLAEGKALSIIGDYFSENSDSPMTVNAHPMVNAAVMDHLVGQLELFTGDAAVGFMTGLGQMSGIFGSMGPMLDNLINIDPTQATTLMSAQGFQLLSNAIDSALQLTCACSTVIDNDLSIPKSDRMAMSDFLKILSEMITNIKQIMHEIAFQSQDLQKKTAEQQLGLIELKSKSSEAKFRKQLEQLEKQREMQKLMKIIGPIIGALVMVASILLSPFSGGASLAILIAVSVTLFAATTALSQTGLLQKGIESVIKAIAENPNISKAGAASIFAGVLAAVAIMMGSAALFISAIGPAATYIAIYAITTVAMTLVMSSNFIGEIAKTLPIPEANRMAFTIGLTLAVGISLAALSGAAMLRAASQITGKSVDVAAKLTETLSSIKKQSLKSSFNKALEKLSDPRLASGVQGGAMLLQGVTSIVQATVSFSLARLAIDESELEAILDMLQTLIKILEKLLDNLGGDVQEIMDAINELTNLFIDTVEGLSASLPTQPN